MARTKSRPVALDPADQEMLTRLVRTGAHPAQEARRARILLELDENDPDREGPVPTQAMVAERAGVHVDTVVKTSKAYAGRGGDIEDTIRRRKRLTPPTPPVVTGEVEARLIKLAPRRHPRATGGGRCGCWRSASCSSTTSPTWTTPPSDGS